MTISRCEDERRASVGFVRIAAGLTKFAWIMGMAGGATALSIEFRFARPPFDHPSAFRTHLVVSHGFRMWLSGPIRLAHDIGLYLFFAFWAIAAALILIDRYTPYLGSQR
jgi:hypothetical protein